MPFSGACWDGVWTTARVAINSPYLLAGQAGGIYYPNACSAVYPCRLHGRVAAWLDGHMIGYTHVHVHCASLVKSTCLA